MTKKRITTTIEQWVIDDIFRKFPKQANRSLSGTIEGMLIVVLNNPFKFWSEKAYYHNVQMVQAQDQMKKWRKYEIEQEKTENTLKARKELIIEALSDED